MAALKNPKDTPSQRSRKPHGKRRPNGRGGSRTVARYRPVAYSVSDVVPPQVPDLASTYVLAGGELVSRGEKVEPGFLQAVAGSESRRKSPSRVEARAGGSPWRNGSLARRIR